MSNYVYGRLPSLNSLEAKTAKNIYVQRGFSDARILDAAKANKVSVKSSLND